MTANELRQKFVEFFVRSPRNHKEIPPASLIINDVDTTSLFTSSGMQQLVPYLMGESHPMGKRLVDVQVCFRAEDITEVGDNRHTTFFEMLGNWSLGDYFKKEQLFWFFKFLTEEVGLDKNKLYVSVFDGDKRCKILLNGKYQALTPDVESIAIWKRIFRTDKCKSGSDEFDPKVKIYTYDVTNNWWSRAGVPENMPVGEIGGPDSEIFYDFGRELGLHEKSIFKNKPCHINCDCGRFLEIGNSVFMQYKKVGNGVFKPLPSKNVDFGGGLERILAAKNNEPDIFKTELFWPIIEKIENYSGKKYGGNESTIRVIADHLKAATFMIAGGLEPDNKAHGYVLRRLLRRAAVKRHELENNLSSDFIDICYGIIDLYKNVYFHKPEAIKEQVKRIISYEMDKFAKSLDKGLKEFERTPEDQLDTNFAFNLFQSYGFPLEITQELFSKRGKNINKQEFNEIYNKHRQLSRTASAGMFKSGLADNSEAIIRLHTATHLLHQSLRRILGNHVQQVGSNITAERLRFDFTHPQKLTPEQINQVERLVNEQIKKNLKIECRVMSLGKAQTQGALAFFGQKYPQKVKVYSIGKPSRDADKAFSKEVCTGPHVDFTGQLGTFKIVKEESSGANKRRIYAVLR